MDGWMKGDGWTDGSLAGRLNEWMNGWKEMDGSMDVWMGGCMNGWMDEQGIDGRTFGWVDERMDAQEIDG